MSKPNQEDLVSAQRLIEDSEHAKLKEVLHHEARGQIKPDFLDKNNKAWKT